MTLKKLFQTIQFRFKQSLQLYVFIFPFMWLMFFLNKTLLHGAWNTLGISPRSFKITTVLSICLSWTMHLNLTHLLNNSIVLAQILVVFGFLERKALQVIIVLIIGSGIATWLLGAPHTNHIGASGLAFAMFGYMLSSALLAKRWEYVLVCVFLGVGFWLSVFKGLIPQEGVSFAGHFGGLIIGLIFGMLFNKNKKNV